MNDLPEVWNLFKNEQEFIARCQSATDDDIDFFKTLHPTFQVNLLQWCLWNVGSGIRAFNKVKYGSYNRKQWAYHKIQILHDYLPIQIWKELVHSSTGFSNRCKSIHYFTRNTYSIDKDHLDKINRWFDEVNGRFMYSHSVDEYGYTPGQYVEFHRKRSEIFKSRAKDKVDIIVRKYHDLEINLCEELHFNNILDFYEALKNISNNSFDDIKIDNTIRKKILEITKMRIESHLIHENLFNDELSKVEKKEEELKRGLSQMTNHLSIIKSYRNILEKTYEGTIIDNILKIKKITI